MKIEDLKSGLEILIANGAEGHIIAAEHDIFYGADAHEIKMPLSEIRKLYKLGWFIDSETDSWAAFT